ncbi:hypothetical protein [Leptospira licerasiae]|uniref:hypothetical protein n=1 Tax=Leptospira licerasiae TaxID=447106 RepID=UPI0010836D2B|nr:hypothetical protein [Leptospira licerasiae]TGM87896.1 hypothetical protein EHR05_14670 [Leptospira licerasiae]
MKPKFSEVQETILKQINHGFLFCFVKNIRVTNKEPNNITITFRDLKTKVRAVDITYNEGTDLYDLRVGKELSKGFVKFSKLEGIFFDQFDDLFDMWTGHRVIRNR